ncbi:hypothetical protein [Streptomyces avermitilis]|uniref:hypothetical protein n=1 Tax=Streptomyces avermitilis TaxID=33903 RepID=UPI003815CA73
MRGRIAELWESLLLALARALLPARGRHRAVPLRLRGRDHLSTPATASPLRPRRPLDVQQPFELDTPLVRPYLLTSEERRERRLRRQRRHALWLAVHGVDVGPRRIHGVEVPA